MQRRRADLVVSHFRPTYSELSIRKMQASRWQLLAFIPQEVFDGHMAKLKANKEEITSIDLRSREAGGNR
jgi:hypothetical protein